MKLSLKICFIFLLTWNFVLSHDDGKIRYDNYRVYKIFITNEEQYSIIKDLQRDSNFYKIWRGKHFPSSSIEILISPEKVNEFEIFLKEYNFRSELKIPNIQKLIDNEQPPGGGSTSQRENRYRTFDWDRYYGLTDIYDWLDEILIKYPSTTESFIVGKSFEGRPIRGIKISYKDFNPGVFIEANIHAREWISSATATCIINELLTSEDRSIQSIARNIDWYIIPVLNVDGFVYSHKKDRLWRKTVKPNLNSSCNGVDGNRNFRSHWMVDDGASSDPCDETYAGSRPFSEPETRRFARYLRRIKDQILIYIALHSFGQLILSPYSFTSMKFPPNHDDMMEIAKATAEAIRNRYNTSFHYGSTASILYTASGTSSDWAYNKMRIPLVYTFELRDTGNYGFILPASQIRPTCKETMDGLVALLSEAENLDYL